MKKANIQLDVSALARMSQPCGPRTVRTLKAERLATFSLARSQSLYSDVQYRHSPEYTVAAIVASSEEASSKRNARVIQILVYTRTKRTGHGSATKSPSRLLKSGARVSGLSKLDRTPSGGGARGMSSTPTINASGFSFSRNRHHDG